MKRDRRENRLSFFGGKNEHEKRSAEGAKSILSFGGLAEVPARIYQKRRRVMRTVFEERSRSSWADSTP